MIHQLQLLCATFHCPSITTVVKKKHKDEMDQHVSHRLSDDHIECVDRDKSFDQWTLSIRKHLRSLIFELFSHKETNPSRIFPERDLDKNGYEQELVLLKQTAQTREDFPGVLLLNSILTIYRHLQALPDLTPDLFSRTCEIIYR